MKKVIYIILCSILVIGLTACGTTEENKTSSRDKEINKVSEDSKSAVIYFSATGTTEEVAEKLANVTSSDIIEIIPKEKYTDADLNYNNDDCRANKEQNDSSARPEIQNSIDVTQYETIYLGYPIWWGDVPKIILTFLDTYDLSGKTVIPFCTSGGSGISQSQNTLENYNNSINWLEGKRFSSNVSETELSNWIEGLK